MTLCTKCILNLFIKNERQKTWTHRPKFLNRPLVFLSLWGWVKFSAEKQASYPELTGITLVFYSWPLAIPVGNCAAYWFCPSQRDSLREETLIWVHNFQSIMAESVAAGTCAWAAYVVNRKQKGQEIRPALTLNSPPPFSGLCPLARSKSSITCWDISHSNCNRKHLTPAPTTAKLCLLMAVVAVADRGKPGLEDGRLGLLEPGPGRKMGLNCWVVEILFRHWNGRSVALLFSFLYGCGLFLS